MFTRDDYRAELLEAKKKYFKLVSDNLKNRDKARSKGKFSVSLPAAVVMSSVEFVRNLLALRKQKHTREEYIERILAQGDLITLSPEKKAWGIAREVALGHFRSLLKDDEEKVSALLSKYNYFLRHAKGKDEKELTTVVNKLISAETHWRTDLNEFEFEEIRRVVEMQHYYYNAFDLGFKLPYSRIVDRDLLDIGEVGEQEPKKTEIKQEIHNFVVSMLIVGITSFDLSDSSLLLLIFRYLEKQWLSLDDKRETRIPADLGEKLLRINRYVLDVREFLSEGYNNRNYSKTTRCAFFFYEATNSSRARSYTFESLEKEDNENDTSLDLQRRSILNETYSVFPGKILASTLFIACFAWVIKSAVKFLVAFFLVAKFWDEPQYGEFQVGPFLFGAAVSLFFLLWVSLSKNYRHESNKQKLYRLFKNFLGFSNEDPHDSVYEFEKENSSIGWSIFFIVISFGFLLFWWSFFNNWVEPYYEGIKYFLPELITPLFDIFFEILKDPVHFVMFIFFTGVGTGIAFSIKEGGERQLNVEDKGVDIVFLAIILLGLAPASKIGEWMAHMIGDTVYYITFPMDYIVKPPFRLFSNLVLGEWWYRIPAKIWEWVKDRFRGLSKKARESIRGKR